MAPLDSARNVSHAMAVAGSGQAGFTVGDWQGSCRAEMLYYGPLFRYNMRNRESISVFHWKPPIVRWPCHGPFSMTLTCPNTQTWRPNYASFLSSWSKKDTKVVDFILMRTYWETLIMHLHLDHVIARVSLGIKCKSSTKERIVVPSILIKHSDNSQHVRARQEGRLIS